MDTKDHFIFLGLVLAVTGAPVFLIFWLTARESDARAEFCGEATIIEVGGCDRYGDCGVRLSDGRSATSRYPVVGGRCQ